MAGPFEEASDSDSITTASTSSSVMEAEYEVEEIKAERAGRRGQKEYLVKWAGYPLAACTWEPGTSFISKLPLDEWRRAKKKIQRGEAAAFDVVEFDAERERVERVENERKQRRKKKREQRQRRLAKKLFSSDDDDDNDQARGLAKKGKEKQSVSLPVKDDDDDDGGIIVVASPASKNPTPPIQPGTDGSISNLRAHIDDPKIVKGTKGKEPIINAPTPGKEEPASAALPYNDVDDADEPLFIAPEAVMSVHTERPSPLREPTVTLITDDIIRHYPQMASQLVCGLLRKIEQRGRGLVGDKIAMRPGAKKFLLDLAVQAGQQTDKRENPWARLWADVLSLCPDGDDDPWSRDTGTPDHDAFLVSEPASDFQTTEWHTLCQKDERRATEHLVAWFAGWTKLRSPAFADCVVCHKSKDDSTPLADIMGWARQWPHLRIMTPAECIALFDESQ